MDFKCDRHSLLQYLPTVLIGCYVSYKTTMISYGNKIWDKPCQVGLRSGNITSRVNKYIFTMTGIRISSLEIMLGDNIYLKASVQRLR